MKIHSTFHSSLFFFIVFYLFIWEKTNAQSFSVTPNDDIIYNHFGVDISNSSFDVPFSFTLKNDSNQTISIKWNRIMEEGCAQNWDFITIDKNLTFTNGILTNVDPVIGTYVPLELQPGEIDDLFQIIFLPNQTGGCCKFSLEFSEVSTPDVILESIQFDLRLNATSSNCSIPTSLKNQNLDELEIFPNPIQDFFTIKTNTPFESMELMDWSGRLVRTFSFSSSQPYDLSGLSTGVYSLILFGKKQKWKTVKLVKL